MNPIGLAVTIAKLAAESSTHAHCIQSDYEEERDRQFTLLKDVFGDNADTREECERIALEHIRKKFTDKAAHQRRIAMRPAP